MGHTVMRTRAGLFNGLEFPASETLTSPLSLNRVTGSLYVKTLEINKLSLRAKSTASLTGGCQASA